MTWLIARCVCSLVGYWLLQVKCFVLPHPGKQIPKRDYSGEVGVIDPFFRRLLNIYAREVFGTELEVRGSKGGDPAAVAARS